MSGQAKERKNKKERTRKKEKKTRKKDKERKRKNKKEKDRGREREGARERERERASERAGSGAPGEEVQVVPAKQPHLGVLIATHVHHVWHDCQSRMHRTKEKKTPPPLPRVLLLLGKLSPRSCVPVTCALRLLNGTTCTGV